MTGIICLNKPCGITSFEAVAAVRRITGEKKAGHTGTLDPMATGVLPVMLGGATRFLALIPSGVKCYKAKFKLGVTTDTLDRTGKVLSEQAVSADIDAVKSVLDRFRGDIMQVPPMYSALSKDGVRLYQLARQGIEIEREARPVTVYSLELLGKTQNDNEYEIFVECSAGTYVRTLISDIGQVLSCGAVMTALCRTMANGFSLENAVTPEALRVLASASALASCLISVEEALSAYERVSVSQAQATRFSNGGGLDLGRISCGETAGFYRIYAPDGAFLGIGEIEPDGSEMKVKRVYLGDR